MGAEREPHCGGLSRGCTQGITDNPAHTGVRHTARTAPTRRRTCAGAAGSPSSGPSAMPKSVSQRINSEGQSICFPRGCPQGHLEMARASESSAAPTATQTQAGSGARAGISGDTARQWGCQCPQEQQIREVFSGTEMCVCVCFLFFQNHIKASSVHLLSHYDCSLEGCVFRAAVGGGNTRSSRCTASHLWLPDPFPHVHRAGGGHVIGAQFLYVIKVSLVSIQIRVLKF